MPQLHSHGWWESHLGWGQISGEHDTDTDNILNYVLGAVHTVTRHQPGEDTGALTTQQSSGQLAQTFISDIFIEFGKQGNHEGK